MSLQVFSHFDWVHHYSVEFKYSRPQPPTIIDMWWNQQHFSGTDLLVISSIIKIALDIPYKKGRLSHKSSFPVENQSALPHENQFHATFEITEHINLMAFVQKKKWSEKKSVRSICNQKLMCRI